MPKSTFFNIDEEKRKRIMDAAFDEFSNELYENASISRIVKNAKIAKGSFYQYFEDKFDLHKYIIFQIGEVKKTYLKPELENLEQKGFIEAVEDLYYAGFRMVADKPKYYGITRNFLASTDNEMKLRIFREFEGTGEDYFGLILSKTLGSKNIDPNVDVQMLTRMITTMHINISESIWIGCYKQGDLDIEAYMNEVRKMLYIIENGMYKGEKSNGKNND